MKPITLTVFLDFVAKQGRPKVTLVRRFLETDYDHRGDLYRRIREGAIRVLRDVRPPEHLDEIVDSVEHKTKRDHFPAIVRGFKHFLEQYVDKLGAEWSEPPKGGLWSRNGITVRVNPEVGIWMDGTPLVLKLYFKQEKLKANRLQIITHLMRQTYGDKVPPGTVMGVLDMRRGNLLTPAVSPDIDIQLDGEAAYWSAVAESLVK